MDFIVKQTHEEWHSILYSALEAVDGSYLQMLEQSESWYPGIQSLFVAFSIPLSKTRYILLGESPYPRQRSANGYAFWDGAVNQLWSQTGFSKEVNRATSLRNCLKMLLCARGDLQIDNTTQAAIASLNKQFYWQTADELFNAFINRGFLLLNASLVYQENEVNYHAKQWRPFMNNLFNQLLQFKDSLQLVLFGRIAEQVSQVERFPCVIAEHPYNLSFISNPVVLNFFKPLDLLSRYEPEHC